MKNFLIAANAILLVLFAVLYGSQQAGCAGRQLTVEEASQQIDVACVLLARALSKGDETKIERLVAQTCNSSQARSVMEKILVRIEREEQSDAGSDFILEQYPLPPDGGL